MFTRWKAGMATLQGKSCGPYLSTSAMRFMKRRYTNVRPLPLVSDWGLQKQRSAPPYGPLWSRTLALAVVLNWICLNSVGQGWTVCNTQCIMMWTGSYASTHGRETVRLFRLWSMVQTVRSPDVSHASAHRWATLPVPRLWEEIRHVERPCGTPEAPHRWTSLLLWGLRQTVRPVWTPDDPPAPSFRRETVSLWHMSAGIQDFQRSRFALATTC